MSEFDPDAFLAQSGGFDPDAFLAGPEERLTPAGAKRPEDGPSEQEALLRGVAQGAALGFPDEAAGVFRAVTNSPADWLFERLNPDAAKEPGPKQQYATGRDAYRKADEEAKALHPGNFIGGELAGGLATSFAPGLNVAKGARLLSALARTGLAGGLTGMGSSTAKDARGMALDTAVGAGIGAATGGLGRLLGRGGRGATSKIAALDEKVARQGAAEAAAETASKRSAAGHAAQDTYRQVEHIRDTGAVRGLPADKAHVVASLEQELGEKAAAKLPGSAAEKARTAAEYAEAVATEGERAAAKAAEKLSAGELKRQVLPRLLRYGLPAAGGAIGLEQNGWEGAAVGALSGAGMRPMMHSLLRGARQPVVQRPALQVGGAIMRGLAPVVGRSAVPATIELSPETAELIRALRDGPLFHDAGSISEGPGSER